MAAVDSFDFLAKEFLYKLNSVRDGFAFVGLYYTSKKAISILWSLYKAVKVHSISKISQIDLQKKFGPWAVVTGSTHGIGRAFAEHLAAQGFNIVIVSIDTNDCTRVSRELVVTGCTGGLGEEFCIQLASRGFSLLLVSRDPATLQNLRFRLENSYGVETLVVAVDFNEGRPVYDHIKKALNGKHIGILVNNVGVMYDYPQRFLDVPYDKLWQLVHCNVAAATMMTHLVLPGMVERKRGAVITVASGASAKPTPQMTVYSATKNYLDYFMRALSYEYAWSGVTFQCLMPFYVATRMTQYSSTLSNPSLLIPTAHTYVLHALSTLGWADRTTGYWPHTLQMWISSLIPEWLWMWGATRLNNALRRQAYHRLRARHRSGSQSRGRLASQSKQRLHSRTEVAMSMSSPPQSPRLPHSKSAGAISEVRQKTQELFF